MEFTRYKISFPHMGKYYIPVKKLIKTLGGDCEVIKAPPTTKRALELGTRNSPDSVCVPFKYNLGNYVEALESGANFLLQTGGGCRMGFYGEVQEQILRDMGYDFKFCMIDTRRGNPKDFYEAFKEINPKLTLFKTAAAFALGVRSIFAMDGIDNYIRKNIGFETEKGALEKAEKLFLAELEKVNSLIGVEKIYRKYMKILKSIRLEKPRDFLKVGVIGELYILMEPFSNYFIEKELARFGIEVERFVTLSYLLFSKRGPRDSLKEADGYLTSHVGAEGTDSVAKAVKLAKAGYDGLIHLKPFGCAPEINCMPALRRVSEDFKIPVLYFSFDSHTSETGVKTRLEAFYDMLLMKKKGAII
jgi:predicted nucleotide-binding protein (sugar kinase/HSP70/actin superfamily)